MKSTCGYAQAYWWEACRGTFFDLFSWHNLYLSKWCGVLGKEARLCLQADPSVIFLSNSHRIQSFGTKSCKTAETQEAFSHYRSQFSGSRQAVAGCGQDTGWWCSVSGNWGFIEGWALGTLGLGAKRALLQEWGWDQTTAKSESHTASCTTV